MNDDQHRDLKITKIEKTKNLWRIQKNMKHDLQETYQLVRQKSSTQALSNHPHHIDNIFILKYFTVNVSVSSSDTPADTKCELKTIAHCEEHELGKLLNLNIKEIQYSENGVIFLDPNDKSSFVYGNLRSGNFNTIHILVQ